MSPLPLEQFPREIRDLIYTCVLAGPSGKVTLLPWTAEVARSLSLLRVSKQIQRECKEIVWRHNGLSIRPTTQLSQYLDTLLILRAPYIEHVKVSLELLDGDELEWAGTALPVFSAWHSLKSVTFSSNWERPQNIWEFQQELELRRGRAYDGRLFHDFTDDGDMQIVTGWPRFCHWGKQNWLREMLLNVERVHGLLRDMHLKVGGEMWIDGLLCFKDKAQLVDDFRLNPRNGEVQMIFGY